MSKTITALQLQKLHPGLTLADATILAPQLNEFFATVPLLEKLQVLASKIESGDITLNDARKSLGLTPVASLEHVVEEVAKDPVVVAIEQSTTEIVAAIEQNPFVKEITNG